MTVHHATPSPRHRLRTRLAAAAVVAPLALALTACGDDDDTSAAPVQSTSSAPAEASSPSGAAEESTTAQGQGGTGGDLLTAATTALAAVDGTLFSIDRDDSGAWDATVVTADGTEQELDISADGASVTRGPVADDDDGDDADDRAEREQLLGASVDYEAAVTAADASGDAGTTVTGVSLDLENGTAEWDVTYDEDTAGEVTVTVDAASGDVVRTERDD